MAYLVSDFNDSNSYKTLNLSNQNSMTLHKILILWKKIWIYDSNIAETKSFFVFKLWNSFFSNNIEQICLPDLSTYTVFDLNKNLQGHKETKIWLKRCFFVAVYELTSDQRDFFDINKNTRKKSFLRLS